MSLWYTFKIDPPINNDLYDAILDIPGALWKGYDVQVPENAGWLVEEALLKHGKPFKLSQQRRQPSLVVPPDAGLDALLPMGLREKTAQMALPYQREGIAWAAERGSGALWWSPGAGKSLAAITWCLYSPPPYIVVTKAAARHQFASEVRNFTNLSAVVVEGQDRIDFATLAARKTDAARGEAIKPAGRRRPRRGWEYEPQNHAPHSVAFFVLGWEILPFHAAELVKLKATALVFDELHRAKSTKRWKATVKGDGSLSFEKRNNVASAALDVARGTPRRLGTTATPVKDRVRDLWAQLDLLDPGAWGPFWRIVNDKTSMGGRPIGFAFRYCNTPEAPIWMADGTFKPLGEIREGDKVVGWGRWTKGTQAPVRAPREDGTTPYQKNNLTESEVLAVSRRQAAIVKVTMASGRTIRCTEDHLWLKGNTDAISGTSERIWTTPKVGANLSFVVDPTMPQLTPEQHRLAGWLGGLYDGEGSRWFIAQCSNHNPEVFAEMHRAMDIVGIAHTMIESKQNKTGLTAGGAVILGGRQGIVDFIKKCRPIRMKKFAKTVYLGGKFRTPDEIVKIEEDGFGDVISMKTSTGNYVAWGYASKNCDGHPGQYGGIDSSGESHSDELASRLQFVAHVVPRSVTHRDLPPKRRMVTWIPPSEQASVPKEFARILKEAARIGGTAYLEAQIMEAAARKREAVVDLIVSALEGGQKVVVLTGRHNDCETLGAAVEKALQKEKIVSELWVSHGGNTTTAARNTVMGDYMASAGPACIIGTMDAWGESVNLQDTDLALFVMLPYTPSMLEQAEGRFTRHGQKRPVTIQYLVAEGTVDERVASILLDKLPAVEKIGVNDEAGDLAKGLMGLGTDEDVVGSLLSKLTSVDADDVDDSAFGT